MFFVVPRPCLWKQKSKFHTLRVTCNNSTVSMPIGVRTRGSKCVFLPSTDSTTHFELVGQAHSEPLHNARLRNSDEAK